MPATLAALRIRNLALVEALDWSPGAGFNAITGETGAGKSVIIGALKLMLGERADKTLIRTGGENCTVEAVFHIEETSALDAQLAEQGIEPCSDSTLILKRVFTQAGTNRQFSSPMRTIHTRRVRAETTCRIITIPHPGVAATFWSWAP